MKTVSYGAWNLKLINNVKDNIVFLAWKMINSDNFSMVCIVEMWKSFLLASKPQRKLFKIINMAGHNVIQTWSHKTLKGIAVNRVFHSRNKGSLEEEKKSRKFVILEWFWI